MSVSSSGTMEASITSANGVTTHKFQDESSLTLSVLHLDHSMTSIIDAANASGIRSLYSQDTKVALEKVVNYVFDHSSFCTASDVGESNAPEKSTNELREKLLKSIMRFVKEQDRWTAFASLLMKSMAFHRSLSDSTKIALLPNSSNGAADDEKDESEESALALQLQSLRLDLEQRKESTKKCPIVDLPRTEYKRPYLPKGRSKENTENEDSKMNVSHQYPQLCMAQWQRLEINEKANQNPSSGVEIGLDVVVFEFRKSDFTPTVDKFLSSFESCFTPWEWNRITCYQRPSKKSSSPFWGKLNSRRSSAASSRPTPHPMSYQQRSDQSKLKEFFLRWSIKEAYTKALGLGMLFDFDSFETVLLGVDTEDPIANGKDSDNDSGANEGVKGNSVNEEGIWSALFKSITTNKATKMLGHNIQHPLHPGQLSVLGQVRRTKLSKAESPANFQRGVGSADIWEFTFIPLSRGDAKGTGTDSNGTKFDFSLCNSCACVCKGPLTRVKADGSWEEVDRQPVVIECLSLLDLIQIHCNGDTFGK